MGKVCGKILPAKSRKKQETHQKSWWVSIFSFICSGIGAVN